MILEGTETERKGEKKKSSSLEGIFFPCIWNLKRSKLKLISPSKQSERLFFWSHCCQGKPNTWEDGEKMPDGKRTEARQAPVTPQGNPQARGFQKLPQNMERQVLRRSREGKSVSLMHLSCTQNESFIQGTRGAKPYYRKRLEKNACVCLGEHRKISQRRQGWSGKLENKQEFY